MHRAEGQAPERRGTAKVGEVVLRELALPLLSLTAQMEADQP